MSCLVLLELVLGFSQVFLLEPDLALLLGGLGLVVALLTYFSRSSLARVSSTLAAMMSLSPLLRWISSSCCVVSILATACLTLMSCWAMFLSISEESNLQTMSPFLTLVPSGTRLMILIWLGVDLADAVDGDAALQVAALGDGDSQGGLAHFREQGLAVAGRAGPGDERAEEIDAAAQDGHARGDTEQSPGRRRDAYGAGRGRGEGTGSGLVGRRGELLGSIRLWGESLGLEGEDGWLVFKGVGSLRRVARLGLPPGSTSM